MGKRVSKPEQEVVGRGKRKCVCGLVLGVRQRECPSCHYIFPSSAKTSKTKTQPISNDFQSLLLAEKSKIEELLQNREQLELRLKAIENILDTF